MTNLCCLDCVFKLDSINSKKIIFLMEIMNGNINMLNPSGEVVIFYNINSRLTVLIDGS